MKHIFIAMSLLFSLIITSANAVDVTQEEKITGLYVAYFNRAADQAGLDYWTNKAIEVEKEGGDVSSVFKKLSAGFATHPVFKSTYDHLNNKEFVSLIYRNALGRAGDTEGIAYWTKKLDAEGMLRSDMVSDFVELSLMTDLTPENYPNLSTEELAAGQLRQDLISNKVLISLLFTIQLDELSNVVNSQDPEEDPAYLASIKIISNVTEDFLTVLTVWDFLDSIQESNDPISEILIRYNNIYDVKTVTITKNNLVAEYEGIKIAFSPYDIKGEKTLTIGKINPRPLEMGEEINTNYQVKAYDFKMEGKTEFMDLIEIAIPYDENFIDTSKDESGSIMAMYYNPESKKYESVDYMVDTEKNKVKIFTDHLSEYTIFALANGVRHGAFKVIHENSRKAYITAVDAYYKYVNPLTATDIINEGISNDMIPGNQAYEEGFNKANEWLGLMAAGNGLASAPFSSTFLTSLGNSFNAIGAGASIVQAAIDLQNGDIMSLYANLSKNTVYNTVNYFGTSALQLAFIGVFAIDYSLSAFANEAWDGSNKKWKAVYDQCYKKHFMKTFDQWYLQFLFMLQDSKDLQVKEQIDQVILDNVYAVWDKLSGSDISECMDDLGYKDLSGNNTSLKIMLAMAKRYELIRDFQEPVFDRLERKMKFYMRGRYRKQLEDLKNQLNQVINVQIKETIKEGDIPKYAGYRFRFAPLNDNATKPEWTGLLDKTGSATGAWRILGYMQAGSPNRLEIFKPEDDPDTDKPVRNIEFSTTPPNLLINISEGGRCGDDGCDFSKLNMAKISFGIDQTDFAYGPYTFTNPVTGETLTNQYDHITGTFSAPDPWESANFLTCSISQYDSGVFSSSCYSSEGKYNLSVILALDSETEPTMFKTVKIHMTDEDGSSVYSNYKNIPLDLSGIQINDDGFVTMLNDGLHGDVGSSIFCNYFQDLSGFYYMNYGNGTINKFELQSYDCSKGGEIFIEMGIK